MFRYLTRRFNKFEPKVGQVIHGFKVQNKNYIPEFHFNTFELEHIATRAKHFHIEADDSNNLFSISFVTPPQNSCGLPHVLEHTTLCGSDLYPVRDPFFNMLKRSLNTYMNAWTSSDHTTYPFSTQNEADYYNLMSVYLDATLHPKLKESDFKQEGHRLEIVNDKLEFKGIVFNEMKGAMGDSGQYFHRYLSQALYPGTIYSFNSGGDPEEILKLTHQDLVQFHSDYYHPSNSLMFSYGNFDLPKQLDFLNSEISKFSPKKLDDPFTRVKRFTEPKRIHCFGPPDQMTSDPTKNIKFAIGYLTRDHSNSFEQFALSFVCDLLLDEPRGAFYKSLIQSGLAPDFCPGAGFDPSHSESSFIIGVQGITKESIPNIEKVIADTFEKVLKEGIDPSLIEASLHSMELSIKKKSTNLGVNLCHSIISKWIHKGDPANELFVNDKIEKLKSELPKGLIGRIIRKYFLENQHRVLFEFEGDTDFVEKQMAREQEMLSALEKQLTKEQRNQIEKEQAQLKSSQEEVQDKSVLPMIQVKEISRTIPYKTDLLQTEKNVYFNEQSTNQINYVKILTPIPNNLPTELIPYLPLFSYVVTKLGARDMNHSQLAEKVELYTGGISSGIIVIPSLENPNTFETFLEFGSYCLERNTEKMIDLITAIYTQPRLDQDKHYLKSLIDQVAMSESNSIMHSGSRYAKSFASSTLLASAQLEESLSGYTSVEALNSMVHEDLNEIISNLTKISQYVLNDKVRVLITGEKGQHEIAQRHLKNIFINQLENKGTLQTPLTEFIQKEGKSMICIPAQVNFAAHVLKTPVSFSHPDSSLLRVASILIGSNYLHREIREKGGAYGSGASMGVSGLFSFSSYRDPNILKTLETFKKAPSWLLNSEITEKEIDEAKLQIFQDLDSPVSPNSKAYPKFIYGITDEYKQKRREEILYATKENILKAAERHLTVKLPNSTTVLGSMESCPVEILESSEWKVINSSAIQGEE
jgi:Zn-dependent M16 (insulinase) family peptidase